MTDALDFFVEGGFGDLAFLDVNDEAVVGANETDVEALFGFVPLAANHDAVAVAVRLRTRNDFANDSGIEAGHALEKVGHLFVFDLKLERIGEVLVLAAATGAEIGTGRFNTIRRWFHDAEQLGAGESFFDLGEFDFDFLTQGHKRNKDDKLAQAAHAFSAEGNVVNGQEVFSSEMKCRFGRFCHVRREI